MIGNREAGEVAGLDQDHVASPLAGKGPAVLEKGIPGLASADGGKTGHGGSCDGDFQQAGLHGERHALLGADFQTAENGLVEVCRGLVLGRALADTAGDGRALGNPNAVLIAVQCDEEFHGSNLEPTEDLASFFDKIVDEDQTAGVVPSAFPLSFLRLGLRSVLVKNAAKRPPALIDRSSLFCARFSLFCG